MTKTIKAAAASTETRRFSMHPKLLLDVIRRQAGSLMKAVLEGVMNSIDAGCTQCSISIEPERVRISDDGSGIVDRDSVSLFFETFGQPHAEEEGKVYGTFRMGRGQMFSFGKNIWRTGPFSMVVDVANRGLDYELKTEKKVKPGCEIDIELYDNLLPSDMAETTRTLKHWLKYAPVTVTLNGEKINVDPEKEKWDTVLPEAYVRLTQSGSLQLFNLGVHTMDFSSHRFGCGGVVVSRKQLKVNFARNDVQADCPVWRKVKPVVDTRAKAVIKKKVSLNDAERMRILHLMAQKDYPDGFINMKVFTSCTGRHFSIADLRSYLYRVGRKITEAPLGSQVGDRVSQKRLAFVISSETLQELNLTLDGFLSFLRGLPNSGYTFREASTVDFKVISGGINDNYRILEEDEYSVSEKIWLDLVGREAGLFRPSGASYTTGRKILVGESSSANAWTDGSTMIAIDRKFLARLTLSFGSFVDIGTLLCHEYCHEAPDTGTHLHGQEFYESFHETVRRRMPEFVDRCMRRVPASMKAFSRAVPAQYLRHADKIAGARNDLQKLLSASETAEQ